nr:uncharacterized protein LOC108082277 [Drosophila kikkawai]
MVRRRLLSSSAKQASMSAYQNLWQQQQRPQNPVVLPVPQYWNKMCGPQPSSPMRHQLVKEPRQIQQQPLPLHRNYQPMGYVYRGSQGNLFKPGAMMPPFPHLGYHQVPARPLLQPHGSFQYQQGNLLRYPSAVQMHPRQWPHQQQQQQQQQPPHLPVPISILKRSPQPEAAGIHNTKRVTIKAPTQFQVPTVEPVKPEVPPKPSKRRRQHLLRREQQRVLQHQIFYQKQLQKQQQEQKELYKQHKLQKKLQKKQEQQKALHKLELEKMQQQLQQHRLKQQQLHAADEAHRKAQKLLEQNNYFNFGKIASCLLEPQKLQNPNRNHNFTYQETKRSPDKTKLQEKPDVPRKKVNPYTDFLDLGSESSTITLTTEQSQVDCRTPYPSSTTLMDKSTNTQIDGFSKLLKQVPLKATSAKGKGCRKLNINELLRSEQAKGLKADPMCHSLMQLVALMCENQAESDMQSRLRAGSGGDGGLQKQYSVYLMVTSDEDEDEGERLSKSDGNITNITDDERIQGAYEGYSQRCGDVYQDEHPRLGRRKRFRKRLKNRLNDLDYLSSGPLPFLPMRRPLHWPKPDYSKLSQGRSNRSRTPTRIRSRSSSKQFIQMQSPRSVSSILDPKSSWKLWEDLPLTAKTLNKAYSRLWSLSGGQSCTTDPNPFYFSMADLVNPSPTIEHGAYESSTYVEAMDPKGEEKSPEENPVMNPKTSPERSSRMCGGDCDCHLPPPLYQQNLTSCDYLPHNECPYRPFQPHNLYGTYPDAGQTYQNPQWQDTQWQWQDPMSMAQWPSNTQPQDYGCCQQQRATGSTNYMEYKGFQHSPKPNPVYVPMECSVYTQESRQGIQSICSCGTIPPCETNYPPKRKRSQGSFAGLKGSFERCRRRKKHYSYEAIISPRRPSTERCCELPRKLNPSDRAYYLRSATPCARTCSNRQHTQVNGPCQSPLPPPPPMRCSPPLRRRSRSRSRCSTRRIRPSPSDCMEKNRPGAEYLKSLDVRANCTYNAQSCDNPAYGRTRSQSPHYQRDSSKRCCCKPSPMTTEPVVCYPPRSRSPCCPRPQPATTKRNCRCSNETLIEEPVKSYRFRCPENRIITLCPHCHKALIKRHRSALTTKRCTSGATRKSCSRFIPVSKMSQVPSNRCIYRTLSRNLTRPKTSSTYRPKYQMNLCCLKRRCQGGANEYRNHHQPASSLKKTQKYPGAPNTERDLRSAPNPERDLRSAPNPERDHRSAPNPDRDRRSAPNPDRDHRSAPNSDRDPRSAPNPEKDPRLASNSGKDPPKSSMSGRDQLIASMSGSDPPKASRGPQLASQLAPFVAPQLTPQLASSPALQREHRTSSPRAEGPSNSRHRHRSHREHSHRKEKNKEQQQPQEPFYPQARPELAPVYMGSPPPANAMPQEVFGHQTYRPANFMGTEINPFYRGTFLDPRSVATSHPYHMGPVQLRKYDALPKLPRTARHPSMMLMPPKWTGLDWHILLYESFFGNIKIMNHRSISEASNQSCSSNQSSVSDVSQLTSGVRCQRSCDPCPGSQPDNPEKIYVLRNDRSPDYTVSPCQKKKPCPRRGSNTTRECPSRSTNYSAERLSQESACGKKMKKNKSKPPRTTPDQKQYTERRAGGNCEICPLCNREEIRQPGQNMCPQCNDRIQTAVSNYYQCKCQPMEQQANACSLPSNQSGQPQFNQKPNVQCQQVNSSLSGHPNLNIIVLQDCQNRQELVDQLANAIHRDGGQVLNQQQSGYQQSVANNYQNNYQDNPGYMDYDYFDYNRGYEQPMSYDYRYDMGPGPAYCPGPAHCPGPGQCLGPGPGPALYSNSYDVDRYPIRTPCTSFECPMREGPPSRQDLYPRPCGNAWQDQDQGQDCPCTCTCNCEFCRKGFETKEKLALLLAQALEIFVQGYQQKTEKKKNQNQNQNQNKNKTVTQKDKRKSAGSTNVKPEKSKQTNTWRKASGKPPDKTNYLGNRAPTAQKHLPSQEPVQSQPEKLVTSPTNSQAGTEESKNTPLPSNSSTADSSQTNPNYLNYPAFFLPNCQEQRSLPDSSWRGRSRDSCSRFGGGDSRRRRRARRRCKYQNRHPSRQCNSGKQDVEDRRCQEECSSMDTDAGQRRLTSGGGKNSTVLLGLSPIAHYRPGMLKFPVNYLLAGTNCRRSLVRTAAGVTLHQKPYVRDLPSFPRKESSHLDCQANPPAKKWL